jgi:phage shock protein E
MNWNLIAIFGAAVVVLFVLKRLALVPADEARRQLQAGALVVDVRSEQEFQARHLPNAINLPLGEIRSKIQLQVPDKTRPLLVHCLSGGRSEIAKRMLRSLGYTCVFNLGAYGRAEAIVAPSRR